MCGDSGKKKSKRRFYIYRNSRNGLKDYLSVHCHNCGYGNPFGKFLNEFDAGLYSAYRLDLFKELGYGSDRKAVEEEIQETPQEVFTEAIEGCVSLLELPEDHHCIRYVESRKIPRSEWGRLWYSDNFKAAMEDFTDGYIEEDPTENLPEDQRLVIPFKDPFGSVTCVQGRALNGSKMRYITIKQTPNSSKVFGLDVLNRTKTVYVLEGPIDSLFVPNSVAVADANLVGFEGGHVMVHDNQPRNRQVCQHINNSIEAGKKVVLFPAWLDLKDVNDMVKVGGFSQSDLMNLINANTYQGLRAKMEFAKWKKF
ncbi:hypothetical protein [Ralstonia phage RSP15]|uniref:DNA primase n=1 Tax=Ralstonia phage RSP15 TaxID=1785960 RepID=UPI00074D323F|nr:DNA primase [Ralstonia phage RSP15]BAU40138.1 hypothetical protein [Ralstonia phage RSP15]